MVKSAIFKATNVAPLLTLYCMHHTPVWSISDDYLMLLRQEGVVLDVIHLMGKDALSLGTERDHQD